MVRPLDQRNPPSSSTLGTSTESLAKEFLYARIPPIRLTPNNPPARGRGRPRIRRVETLIPPHDPQLLLQPVVRLDNIHIRPPHPPVVDLTEENFPLPPPPRPPVFEPQPGPSSAPDEPQPSTSRGFPTTNLNEPRPSTSRSSPVPSTLRIIPTRLVPIKPLPKPSSSADSTSETTLHPNVRSLSLFADPKTLSREEVYVQEIFIRAHYGGFDECLKPSCMRLKEDSSSATELPSSPILGRPANQIKKQKTELKHSKK